MVLMAERGPQQGGCGDEGVGAYLDCGCVACWLLWLLLCGGGGCCC